MKNNKIRLILGVSFLGLVCAAAFFWNGKKSEVKKVSAPIVFTEEIDTLYAPTYEYNEETQRSREVLINPSDVNVNRITKTGILSNVMGNEDWVMARPIFINHLPSDFPTQGDYLLYVRAMLPLILRENQAIEKDRAFLIELAKKQADGIEWTPSEKVQFEDLTKKYDTFQKKLPGSQLDELLERVDIIPPSLAMAQSAVQTNWGKTFSAAPFGQMAWVNGKYVFKPFDTLPEAVHSYMIELNTLPQYKSMRMRRQIYKKMRGSLGAALTEEMQTYMPSDPQYVGKLNAVYKSNDLWQLDQAHFGE